MEQEWYWEGNVQSRIVGYLQTQGWRIIREADTERHEKGVDILAFRDGKMLAIEVKGYPSSRYASGPKKGQDKPTPPHVQAQHSYADALMHAIRHIDGSQYDGVAMALPDFEDYRALVEQTKSGLSRLRIGVLIIPADGNPTWLMQCALTPTQH